MSEDKTKKEITEEERYVQGLRERGDVDDLAEYYRMKRKRTDKGDDFER